MLKQLRIILSNDRYLILILISSYYWWGNLLDSDKKIKSIEIMFFSSIEFKNCLDMFVMTNHNTLIVLSKLWDALKIKYWTTNIRNKFFFIILYPNSIYITTLS